tara:strand:+ start:183 stop:590 length:408 start_codon:yes stop_codon:yes gene_type:complete
MDKKYITQNNIHNNFPGLMSDSRLYTNYESDNLRTNIIKLNKNIKNNEDLRYYMIHNSDKLMKINRNYYTNGISLYAPKNDILDNTEKQRMNNPYLFNSVLDEVQPYGYETNFTKDKYLSRVKLAHKKVNKYKQV